MRQRILNLDYMPGFCFQQADFFTGIPGASDIFQTVEKELAWGTFSWGPWEAISVVIDSAAVDAGNTPTTLLRKGLALGMITATKKWTPYVATATDGSQFPQIVLAQDVNMLNPMSGSAEDKMSLAIVSGPIQSSNIPNIDNNVRRMLGYRFLFSDDLIGNNDPWKAIVQKGSNYTVTVSDNNIHFEMITGTVTFTLPAVGTYGLNYLFTSSVDANMVITAPSGKFILDGNAAATTATFSTSSHKIGSALWVRSNGDASKYIGINVGGTVVTPS